MSRRGRGGFKGGHRSRTRHYDALLGEATFSDAQDYVRAYPAAAKLVRRCRACGREGYRPDMSNGERFARNLRRMLEPLELDEDGLCSQCRHGLKGMDA